MSNFFTGNCVIFQVLGKLCQICGHFFLAIVSCSTNVIRIIVKPVNVVLAEVSGFYSAGEREEVHAASGQPEGQGCGKGLHVQQAHVCHLQYRATVQSQH